VCRPRAYSAAPVLVLHHPGEAKRLVSILRAAADTLDITGGEPLMRDDLEEILAHASAIGLRTVLNTKGIGLEDRPGLMRHTTILVLSLDSMDPDALATLIGRPRHMAERMMAAMEYALAESRRTGTRIVLAAVATPGNLAEVSKVLEFAMEHSLGFHLSPQIMGTEVNPLLRGHDGYHRLIEQVLQMKRTRRGVLGVREYIAGIRDFRAFRCHPLLMPVIRPDGRMYYPCLERKQAEISLLDAGDYAGALRAARERFGSLPACRNSCHIFCHMALSLLQSHPTSALQELKHC
jgi:molybdenum cofactor biosynthesis enzyme MoaA